MQAERSNVGTKIRPGFGNWGFEGYIFRSNFENNRCRFLANIDCKRRMKFEIPEYYWVKNRGSVEIGVVSLIPIVAAIIDLFCCLFIYSEKIGKMADFTIYWDAIVIFLSLINFCSIFKISWAICGYYCQMIVGIIGLFGGLPYRMCIGMAIPESNYDNVVSKIESHAVAFMVIGTIGGGFSLFFFFIWIRITNASAMQDPEIVDYIEKWSTHGICPILGGISQAQTQAQIYSVGRFPQPYSVISPQQNIISTSLLQNQSTPMGIPVSRAPANDEPPSKQMNAEDEIKALQVRLSELQQKKQCN